jgi:hypothetical protein
MKGFEHRGRMLGGLLLSSGNGNWMYNNAKESHTL